MTLADRVVVLRKGEIVQHGRPLELYETPNCRFVAEFIGSPQMNILPGEVVATDGGKALAFAGGLIRLGQIAALPGTRVDIGLRPEHLLPCAPEQADFTVEIDVLEELGSDTMAICMLDGREITVQLDAAQDHDNGQTIPLRFERRNLHVFDAESGNRVELGA
jgi:ABC-type sugar transport system ATPase subunit